MMERRYRRLLVFLAGAATISAACGTAVVPFEPSDGAGGQAGDSSVGGTTGGSSTDGKETGGRTSTGGQSGGTGGNGGSLNPGFGAAGGMGGYVGDLVLSGASTIRGIATTATHVYWSEYGTFDQLDNYLFDGSLMSMDLESGEVETVLEDLEGPVQVEVTSEEAFLLLERSTNLDPDGDRAVGRINLSSGALELVDHEGSYSSSFRLAAFEDRAYFPVRVDGTWAVREFLPGEPGRVVLPMDPGQSMVADATNLYFIDGLATGFWRVPVTGDVEPDQLSGANYWTIALESERVLTTRGQTPMYLAAMSKNGGAWSNVVRLGNHHSCDELVVVGVRFFAQCASLVGDPYLIVGLWSGTRPLASYTLTKEKTWAATHEDLFIAHGTELFRIALDP